MAAPFVWPSCTSLVYFQAAFTSYLKYFSVIWLLLNQRVDLATCSVAVPPHFLKIEKSLHPTDVLPWGRAWVLMQTEGCPSHTRLISHVILMLLLVKEQLSLGMGGPWGPFSVGLSLLVPLLQVRRFGFLLLSVEICLGSQTHFQQITHSSFKLFELQLADKALPVCFWRICKLIVVFKLQIIVSCFCD